MLPMKTVIFAWEQIKRSNYKKYEKKISRFAIFFSPAFFCIRKNESRTVNSSEVDTAPVI